MKRTRIYIGLHAGTRQIFRAAVLPTQATHGHLYAAVIGPFRTLQGAQFMRAYGGGNPHCVSVADAERLCKPGVRML